MPWTLSSYSTFIVSSSMLSEFLGRITGILKIVGGVTTSFSIFNVVVAVALSTP